MIAYVDGTWSPSDEARISVLDHGLLYGVVPVRELDGRPIGAAGRPVTQAVRTAFRRYIAAL